jgi:hypothetical protein
VTGEPQRSLALATESFAGRNSVRSGFELSLLDDDDALEHVHAARKGDVTLSNGRKCNIDRLVNGKGRLVFNDGKMTSAP